MMAAGLVVEAVMGAFWAWTGEAAKMVAASATARIGGFMAANEASGSGRVQYQIWLKGVDRPFLVENGALCLPTPTALPPCANS